MWNYYRDELADDTNDNNGPNKNVIISKTFKYKTSTTGSTYNVPKRITGEDGNLANNPNYGQRKRGTKEVEIVVSLKHLGKFLTSLNIPLVNCEESLALSWSATCVITSMEKRILVAGQPNRRDSSTNATFKIKDTKWYVPVVTLSAENDNKLLEELKKGLKRTITWNKYKSEMSNQVANNNLNYLIDPTFTNVNRLFVLSFKNERGNNDESENVRTSFKKYYVPKAEIKDFNVLFDGKPFFEIPVKSKEEVYEKIIEISKTNDYTTGNLLDYEYFSKHNKLTAIDLSKQTELENPDLKQQINFIGKFEEDATMFFIIEKKEETTFDFSQNSITVVRYV